MTSTEECRKHFPDDPTVADEVLLLRRIPPWHFIKDDNAGARRPSSAAFEDDDDGDPMSVYRTDVIEAEGGQPVRVMRGHDGFGLVSLLAGAVRHKKQTVHPDPLTNEKSHTQVCGPKTKATKKYFVRRSNWVISPPNS